MKDFMIVLVMVLSLPFLSIAEQHFQPSTTSEVGTTENINVVWIIAKHEAERDARRDVNGVLWGIGGGVVGFVSGAICMPVRLEHLLYEP